MSELNIPSSWSETSIGNLGHFINGYAFKSKEFVESSDYQLVRMGNVTPKGLNLKKSPIFLSQKIISEKQDYKLEYGDLLISLTGTIGKEDFGYAVLVDCDNELYVNQRILAVRSEFSRFLNYYFNTFQFREQFFALGKGQRQANVSAVAFKLINAPLPPSKEQERIVQKIESCFEKIDATEQSLTKVETLLEKYRESLLAKAFRGELIPQNESDEPASVLLEKIRAEREKSAPAKKKKVQAFAPITDDEKPFDIPESWEWVRLGEYIKVKGGKRVPKGESLVDTKTDYPYIRVADMKKMTVSIEKLKYLSKEVYDTIKNYTISKDDLYITVAGTIGRIGYVPAELDNANLTENADKLTSFDDVFHKDFLMYMLLSRFVQEQIRDKTKQVAQPKLSVENINKLVLVVPPLHEQKNILRQVVESLSSIKKIKNQNKVKLDFINLMRESVLSKAFEGRLVEQIESEGTGQELLEKILKAKAEEASKKKVAKKKTAKKKASKKKV